jgi:hypothetical protein
MSVSGHFCTKNTKFTPDLSEKDGQWEFEEGYCGQLLIDFFNK